MAPRNQPQLPNFVTYSQQSHIIHHYIWFCCLGSSRALFPYCTCLPRRLRHDIRPSDLDGFIIPPADIAYIRLHSNCLDTSVPFYLIRSTVQSVQLITNIHPLPCMPLPAIEETLHHSSPLFYYQSSKRHGLPPEPFPKRPAITRTTTLRMPGCTHVGHTHPPPYDNDSVKPRPRLEGYSSSTRQMNIITQQRCWLAQG